MAKYWQMLLTGSLAIGAPLIFPTTKVIGQNINLDGSLGTSGTLTGPNYVIPQSAGQAVGNNLFHSFGKFNLNANEAAIFSSADNIRNIFSRVTGGTPSNIDGLIRTLGSNVNFFLINPSGIIFGQNARLDVGGSFVASTANSFVLGDRLKFSATNPQAPPLLTINVPIGLQFGNNTGSIQIQGNGQDLRLTSDLIDTQDALRVAPNQTLALVGGDINLEAATLKTAGGRIELGSVAGEGLVSLTPINKGFSLGYDSVKSFGNIQLVQQAAVDASGEGAGDVQVVGRRITLTDGSQIEASTLGSKSGGSLVVNAPESVELIGTSSDGQIPSRLIAAVYPGVTGTGGELKINTGTLLVRDGATIANSTLGLGNAGNLTVNASEAVQVIGIRADGPSLLSARTHTGATGAGGNLTINTGTLLVQDGAQVSASTFGAGKAGNLSVNATKGIQLIGTTPDGQFGSGLYAHADRGSTGAGGNLTINTTKLLVQNGAEASAGTFSTGNGGNLTINATEGVQVIGMGINNLYNSDITVSANRGSSGSAGNLTINTPELIVREGAYVGAFTNGSGKGGNLTVNATKRVQVIGTDTTGQFFSHLSTSANRGLTGAAGNLTINTGDLIVEDGAEVSAGTFGAGKGGNLTVNALRSVQVRGTDADGFPSALATQAAQGSTGSAGDMTINTRNFQVRDGAAVIVRSFGQGNAGNLNINANSIRLNNKAILTADTRSVNVNPNKEQATINLNSQDLILGRGSNISTNATGNNVIGGNINIKTSVLAALENSDITANSTDFRGGRVRIATKGIFGTQFRNPLTPESDITATGASPELSGTVEINTPDADPSRGLIELPTNLVDASQQIAQGCTPRGRQNASRFISTGRGGLPLNPYEPLRGRAAIADWVDLSPQVTERVTDKLFPASVTKSTNQIVEAQGWIVDANGDVILVAQSPQISSFSSAMSCNQ